MKGGGAGGWKVTKYIASLEEVMVEDVRVCVTSASLSKRSKKVLPYYNNSSGETNPSECLFYC